MSQIDMFDEKYQGTSFITENIGRDWEHPGHYDYDALEVQTRRIEAAYGQDVADGQVLKLHKKTILVHEFQLATADSLKKKMQKSMGVVVSSGGDAHDPQYLANVYKHQELVAVFCRDFAEWMSLSLNAVHLFTVATVFEGRLLIFVENGIPLIEHQESADMLVDIEKYINKSRVYKIIGQRQIHRTF